MKVVSFNIRYIDDPNGHAIKERAPRLKLALDKQNADLVGFQEVVPEWVEHLKADYSEDYELIYLPRAKTDGEGAAIMWKKDKFALLEKGHFWFSDTPDVESRGWDERYNCYRICLWVKLLEKETGKEFVFADTHYGFGDNGQSKSSKLIYERLSQLTDTAIIVGDFNMKPEDKAYSVMCENFTDVNAVTAKDFSTTFHGYGTCDNEHIDYCFVTDKTVESKNSALIKDTFDGKYPSDHYGLCVEVNLK